MQCGERWPACSARCQHQRVSTSEADQGGSRGPPAAAPPGGTGPRYARTRSRIDQPRHRGLRWRQRPSHGCFCPQQTIVVRWPPSCPHDTPAISYPDKTTRHSVMNVYITKCGWSTNPGLAVAHRGCAPGRPRVACRPRRQRPHNGCGQVSDRHVTAAQMSGHDLPGQAGSIVIRMTQLNAPLLRTNSNPAFSNWLRVPFTGATRTASCPACPAGTPRRRRRPLRDQVERPAERGRGHAPAAVVAGHRLPRGAQAEGGRIVSQGPRVGEG